MAREKFSWARAYILCSNDWVVRPLGADVTSVMMLPIRRVLIVECDTNRVKFNVMKTGRTATIITGDRTASEAISQSLEL